MDVVIFCLLMYVAVSPTSTLKGGNICQRNVTTDRGELEAKEICCKDYEEKNDKCVECYGSWGWNCSGTCPENHYGGKCSKICTCDNETQICHPVCGCLKRLDLNNSNMTNNETIISLKNVTSSPYAEECPSTIQVLSTTTVSTAQTSTAPLEKKFKIEFLIGAASVTCVCIVSGIGLLYRLHFGRKKAGSRIHHNMVYDLEDTSRIRGNPTVHEEPAEPLYGECSYEDTCYSKLVLRVNNDPHTSRQPVFTDEDNIYEFAQRYTHHSDEEQPPNVYITDLIEATE